MVRLKVNCPEGMTRTQTGCKYFALKWFLEHIRLQLKLTPVEGNIPVTKLIPYLPLRKHSDLLDIPCNKGGFKVQMYIMDILQLNNENDAAIRSKNTFVSSAVLDMSAKFGLEGLDPSRIVPVIKTCITGRWKLNIENKTYELTASFDKLTGYESSKYESQSPGNLNKHMFKLSKPFFCNNVRIPMFDVRVEGAEIRILSNNITLGSNEFIKNSPDLDGNPDHPFWNLTTFTVCIEDFDPSYMSSSNRKLKESRTITALIGLAFSQIVLALSR
ncbi:uncharacterized protein LOC132743082 [Ruditapes philippinarum]|uniref:uncharacterized protein LOC132743082 n=1 Tax=Ruditapes philippinarum TaxID=129788 RepID=UPI00295B43AC|nr:uncharacterized protein LOC132743082 [Ruditapes philippinarum]